MTQLDSIGVRWSEWIVTNLARTRTRARATVAGVLILTGIWLSLARGIRVNANLEVLLDPDSPSVAALEELRHRQGSTDPLYIAIKSTDRDENLRMMEEIAASIQTWPEVLAVEHERDYTPIRDRALYFLEVDELRRLRDDLLAERRKAVAREMALGIGDGNDPDLAWVVVGDDWDAPIDDLGEHEALGDREAASEKPRNISDLLQEQRAKIIADGRIPSDVLDRVWPRENDRGEIVWHERVAAPLESVNRRREYTHLVKVRLEGSPTDLDYARKIYRRAEDLISQVNPSQRVPGALGKVGGAWNVSKEASSILRDLRGASGLSAALVIGVLVAGFRSWRVLPIVLMPVAVSVVASLAVARMMFGELSVLTAFLFAVLLGIGVDFSVHLYAARERQGTRPDWAGVLRIHFRPLAASMITTVGSFLVLSLADFRGFEEFGLIASVGVMTSFVVALVLVPAVDVALGPLRSRAKSDRTTRPSRLDPGLIRKVRWGAILGILVITTAGSPRVAFETNLRNLRAPKTTQEERISYTRPLGQKRSGTPAVILADDPQSLDAAVDALRADMDTVLVPDDHPSRDAGQPWIRDVMALRLYMPTNQEAKRAVIQDIGEHAGFFLAALPDLPADDLSRNYETHLQTLQKLAIHPPMTRKDLPTWARLPFLEKDGTTDQFGLLYVRVPEFDLAELEKATRRFREVTATTGARGASSRFVLADLTSQVEQDAGRLPPLALLAILVLIATDLRRLIPTVVCFGTLCLGLGLTFGVMGLYPIRISFYNMVVMPSVIGLGIDASIHLWHARSRGAQTVRTTGKAALISALTTAGGFAGLVVAEHRGLHSIGTLGVVATLCTVAAALVILGRAPVANKTT